jgi:uncharacterized integral membrane protein
MTYEQENNKLQSIILQLFILPLYIINIIFGVKYIDDNCTDYVGEISFKFPLWLIICGSIGCLKLIFSIFDLNKLIQIIGLFDISWFIIGNILFWNGTLECIGELYKLGLANMIIGYIMIFLTIIILILICIFLRKNSNNYVDTYNV